MKCTQEPANPDARMPEEYDIEIDGIGRLISVNGEKATRIGRDKYKVGYETFWYYDDTKRLMRYDAAIGDVYWSCT